jgi:hypothetical protein
MKYELLADVPKCDGSNSSMRNIFGDHLTGWREPCTKDADVRMTDDYGNVRFYCTEHMAQRIRALRG